MSHKCTLHSARILGYVCPRALEDDVYIPAVWDPARWGCWIRLLEYLWNFSSPTPLGRRAPGKRTRMVMSETQWQWSYRGYNRASFSQWRFVTVTENYSREAKIRETSYGSRYYNEESNRHYKRRDRGVQRWSKKNAIMIAVFFADQT